MIHLRETLPHLFDPQLSAAELFPPDIYSRNVVLKLPAPFPIKVSLVWWSWSPETWYSADTADIISGGIFYGLRAGEKRHVRYVLDPAGLQSDMVVGNVVPRAEADPYSIPHRSSNLSGPTDIFAITGSGIRARRALLYPPSTGPSAQADSGAAGHHW